MKTLAKYHVCKHSDYVIGEKTFKNILILLSGPVSYRDFRETGPREIKICTQFLK